VNGEDPIKRKRFAVAHIVAVLKYAELGNT